jgi:methylenetetrahydrofolate--tRNA-(uracil-5-)-methyltransferase
MIHIIGGGLAGSEAAWQAAALRVPVVIHEMRPVRATAVHKTDRLAELVCSNSFRGDKLDNAVGLLKEEMRRLGSLVMKPADAHRVPCGRGARRRPRAIRPGVTDAVHGHPLITVVREELSRIPTTPQMFPLIVATGPLTSMSCPRTCPLVGRDHLYFYDAISPIVLAETIDLTKVFRASRWDRSLRGPQVLAAHDGADLKRARRTSRSAACGVDDGQGDYLNCPLTKTSTRSSTARLSRRSPATVHDFDKEKFFEGCLPIEVMAHRGPDTLRFGPDEARRAARSSSRAARRMRSSNCARTTLPAITSAWSASRRS